MTRICVEDDEFYPWFDFKLADEKRPSRWSDDHYIDVDDATLARWREAIDAARKVQREIHKAVKWDGG